jgi:hypothetical protein
MEYLDQLKWNKVQKYRLKNGAFFGQLLVHQKDKLQTLLGLNLQQIL